MQNLLWALFGLDALLLLVRSSVPLEEYELSEAAFREKYSHKSDPRSKLLKALYHAMPEMRRLKQAEVVLFGTVLVALLTNLLQPIYGLLISLALFLMLAVLVRLKFIKRISKKSFENSLPASLFVIKWLTPLWWLIGLPPRKNDALPTSKFEFLYQLQRLPSTVLEPAERQRLEDSLQASSKTVEEIMTPKKQVVSVSAQATLGPIVLDDLVKTGHGLFPVLNKNGEVVGILDLAQVGDLENAKTRQLVKELMSGQIHTIESTTSLLQAAQAFLGAKQYLLLVTKDEAFAGIVTIADLLRSLTGIVKDE